MSEETKHKVSVEYKATDAASPTAEKIAHSFHNAGHAVEGVKEKFKEFRRESLAMAAGVFGLGLGMGGLIETTSEAVREFGGAQKAIASTLATVLQWPAALEPVDRFSRSMVLAKGVTQELDDAAAEFGMGLQDLGGAYRTLAIAAAPLKLSQQQLMELTIKSAAAAKQFGIDAGSAADQIGRTLVTKTVKASGDLGKFLVTNLGGNLKKLNNEKVLEKMDAALKQSMGIAEQMGQGMGGSIARIQNRVQDMFREIGGPLFRSIAGALDGLAKKMKTLGEDGKPLLETYAKRLVEAFDKLKGAAGFIVDHWRTIAVIVAGIKLPAALNTFAGLLGTAAGAGGIFKNVGTGFTSMMGGGGLAGFGGFISALGPATAAVVGIGSAALLAAQALKGVYDEWQGRKQQAAGMSEFFKEIGEVNKTENLIRKHERQLSADQVAYMRDQADQHAGLALKILDQKGLIEGSNVNLEKFNGIMSAMGDDVRERFQQLVGSTGFSGDMSSGMLGSFAAEILQRHMAGQRFAELLAPDDSKRKTAGTIQNFYGGIHITQNYEEAEPDRVFVRIRSDLESYAHRRTSSALSEPLGD